MPLLHVVIPLYSWTSSCCRKWSITHMSRTYCMPALCSSVALLLENLRPMVCIHGQNHKLQFRTSSYRSGGTAWIEGIICFHARITLFHTKEPRLLWCLGKVKKSRLGLHSPPEYGWLWINLYRNKTWRLDCPGFKAFTTWAEVQPRHLLGGLSWCLHLPCVDNHQMIGVRVQRGRPTTY